MSALYAFCREVDDVADNESAPVRNAASNWPPGAPTCAAPATSESPQFPVNRELQPVIRQYHLPFELFDDLLKGCEMDLDIKRYENFEELELYCYRVASVVGLLSIEIFGYQNPACRDYAVYLGKALQLTNILRDVRTDAERGRNLSAAVRTEKIQRHATRKFCSTNTPTVLRTGRQRRRPRERFLSARRDKPCPPRTATRWSPPN